MQLLIGSTTSTSSTIISSTMTDAPAPTVAKNVNDITSHADSSFNGNINLNEVKKLSSTDSNIGKTALLTNIDLSTTSPELSSNKRPHEPMEIATTEHNQSNCNNGISRGIEDNKDSKSIVLDKGDSVMISEANHTLNGVFSCHEPVSEKSPLLNDVMVIIADPTFETKFKEECKSPKHVDTPQLFGDNIDKNIQPSNGISIKIKNECADILVNKYNKEDNGDIDKKDMRYEATNSETVCNNKIVNKDMAILAHEKEGGVSATVCDTKRDNTISLDEKLKNNENSTEQVDISKNKTIEKIKSIDLKEDATKNRKNLSENVIDTFNVESDDETEHTKNSTSTPNAIKELDTKPCVSLIDDDDDIVLVEESHSKTALIIDDKSKSNDIQQPTNEKSITEEKLPSSEAKNQGLKKINDSADIVKLTCEDIKSEETSNILSIGYMNTFKESLGQMSRGDLEEFCIIKVVEAITRRSNLSEVKHKVKTLEKTIDAWRKKVAYLSKQNKDLEIVVRCVNEAYKRSEQPIPIKIMRAVGMQVGTPNPKGFEIPNQAPPLIPLSTLHPSQAAQQPSPVIRKGPKKSPTPSAVKPPIQKKMGPTGRVMPMLPALPKNMKPPPTPNSNVSTSNTPILATALSTSGPTNRMAEKRTSMQSIDLTDDEPPSKMHAPSVKNMTPPRSQGLRMVSPPTTRMFFVNPAKPVYIPISSQTQTSMNTMTARRAAGPRNSAPLRPIYHNIPMKIGQAIPIRQNVAHSHPAPLPATPMTNKQNQGGGKFIPPRPLLKIRKVDNGIVISWEMEELVETIHEKVASYQIFAYQETSLPPSTDLWKKIGDVKSLPLPMACTLTHFMAGYKYYFAVRALDIRSRFGPFSAPGDISLT